MQSPARPTKSITSTVFARLKNKLTSLAPPKGPTTSASLPNAIISKGMRAAALRERGLLSPEPHHSALHSPLRDREETMTEARRVKEEWERRRRLSMDGDRNEKLDETATIPQNGPVADMTLADGNTASVPAKYPVMRSHKSLPALSMYVAGVFCFRLVSY
jgi:hypothetical protein